MYVHMCRSAWPWLLQAAGPTPVELAPLVLQAAAQPEPLALVGTSHLYCCPTARQSWPQWPRAETDAIGLTQNTNSRSRTSDATP